MSRRKHRFGDGLPDQAVGTIGVVLAVLVLDDILLNAKLVFGKRGDQMPHPVRFHRESHLNMGGGNVFEIVCSIG